MAKHIDKHGMRLFGYRDVNLQIYGMCKTLVPSLSELVDVLHDAGYTGSEDRIIKALNDVAYLRDLIVSNSAKTALEAQAYPTHDDFLTDEEISELNMREL